LLIDAHSHIDSKEFDKDREVILKKCDILVVDAGINFDNDLTILELSKKYSNIIPAGGLHPENIDYKNFDQELNKVLELLDKFKIISEIGLDYYWIKEDEKRRIQKTVLERFLSEAEKRGKPLIVHIRGGIKDFLDIIPSYKVIFDVHAYEGNIKNALRIIELGGYISFPPVIIRDKQRQIVAKEIPIDRVLTETDSPYLGPTRDRNEPCNVSYSIKKLGEIWNIDDKSIERLIENNFKRFLGI
jgi:TatD DNase family protein